MVSIKKIESYKDYGKCLCITNGVIEAYVTTDIGQNMGIARKLSRNILSRS